MDQSLKGLYDFADQFIIDDDKCLDNGVVLNNTSPQFSGQTVRSSIVVTEGDSHEDYDFSDVVLKYINDILMEEDVREKNCMFQESSAALQAAEKSLYELIYPPLPNSNSHPARQNHENPDKNCNFNHIDYKTNIVTYQSSHSSANSSITTCDGFVDSPVSTFSIPEIFNDSESVMNFKKGFEEASKFIPKASSLLLDLECTNGLSLKELKDEVKDVEVQMERGKKNPHPEDLNFDDGRSNKQTALYTESSVSPEMFDMVLLSCGRGDSAIREAALREALQQERSQQNGQSISANGGKKHGKRKGKKEIVDMRTLLTLCAQAVSANDWRTTNEFLKKIRQHSSPTGDGVQRMSHYFADGLEARLAGSGTQVYKALISKPTSAADVLKAYHLYITVCPFRKLSNFFANKTITNVSENATRLHIIDFGVMYGFQWPCFIRRLSCRPGGPPKLRITGIDLPNPGFRPAERVEETGNRLANYAKMFNVPFEFHAIAQKWDTIKIEDLKIEKDELLIVNCLYRLHNLLDETVVVESPSPRNKVLNLIRKINPCVFIHGVINGSYNAPFFITRFRESLFHYSAWFDMLENNLPRDIPERTLIEREIYGWEAMNVIACEGGERIERPETYKQWQTRMIRAGFIQLPLTDEIKKMAKEKVKRDYHKDFVIDEDGQWLLQGWKGRIVHSLSCWTPGSAWLRTVLNQIDEQDAIEKAYSMGHSSFMLLCENNKPNGGYIVNDTLVQ
ncbi:hypothetical protein ACFE04_029990 [Oxalis oulophora]